MTLRSLAFVCGLGLMAAPPATDISTRLSKWKPVKMAYSPAGLSERERQVVEKLVAASRAMEPIYWQMVDPDGLKLYQTTKDPNLKRLIGIHGGRFDLLDENRPFTGTEPMPPGRNIYPKGLTRERIEQYAQKHPNEKPRLYGGHTVVRWQGDKLATIPYHVEFSQYLKQAAKLLREAAALTPDKAFGKFLELRADALLTDDYLASDLAWVDLKNPKIDIILEPNETYIDGVLGVKTGYEGVVLIRNEAESKKLDLYQRYVPEIQDALPLPAADRPSKRGHATPMEVMDNPYRAGLMRHGYQPVADNLPNDPRVHAAKGSKKVFFKNFMDARVDSVILPLARYVMTNEQAAKASGDGYMSAVVMHEICHGLGPTYARINGQQVDIRESLGPVEAALEEAKADVTGMFGLAWLMDHGALPKARSDEYYASYVAGIFRSVRFGTAEPHGRAEIMEFNYLSEQKAIVERNGRYVIDFGKMPTVLRSLTKELLEQEATGDRKRAEAWFNRYDKMPAALKSALDAAKDVPVDIEAVYSFHD